MTQLTLLMLSPSEDRSLPVNLAERDFDFHEPQGTSCVPSAMPCRSLGWLRTAVPLGAAPCAPHSTSGHRVQALRSPGGGRVCLVCWALAPPVHKYFSLWIFVIVDFRLFPCYTLDCHHYPLWIFAVVDFRLFQEESA